MKATRITILFAALASLIFTAIYATKTAAQKARGGFSHASAAHQKVDCGSCHKNPTSNWVSARGFPDVADYPGHDSCVRCHQNDFFRGNRPAICTVCHVNAGPRANTRFPFPAENRRQEFETIFPHDVHQNIIALNERKNRTAVVHFANASFDDDAKKPEFNNCAICHATAAAVPAYTTLQPLRTAALANPEIETFAPKAAFFKNMPQGHVSCFGCHYRGQEPVRTDCAGCHRLTSPYFESDIVRRFSIKFDHSSDNHANKDCTVCHIRITQTSDLRALVNADVPLLTCSSSACHVKELRGEIGKREKSIADKQEVFQCAYCHTYSIGSYKIPENHLEQAK